MRRPLYARMILGRNKAARYFSVQNIVGIGRVNNVLHIGVQVGCEQGGGVGQPVLSACVLDKAHGAYSALVIDDKPSGKPLVPSFNLDLARAPVVFDGSGLVEYSVCGWGFSHVAEGGSNKGSVRVRPDVDTGRSGEHGVQLACQGACLGVQVFPSMHGQGLGCAQLVCSKA